MLTDRDARAAGAEPTDRAEPLVRRFDFDWPVDLRLTLEPLRHCGGDLTIRISDDEVWLARRTNEGSATLRLRLIARDAASATVQAQAWGPGAIVALDAIPGLAGAFDRPDLLEPHHALVHELVRRMPGFRMTRTGQLLPELVPAALGQKVTGIEMARGYVGLLRLLGEPAPGPGSTMGLLVPPPGEQLAALPYFELHQFGVERRRADLVRRLAGRARSIEALTALSPSEASARLQTISGVGPWTAAEAVRTAFGDPDAVSIGDAHVHDMVGWALAAEPRASDERMLEILEPYRGQRARVVALLEAGGVHIPRFGPRFSPRGIDRI